MSTTSNETATVATQRCLASSMASVAKSVGIESTRCQKYARALGMTMPNTASVP